MKCFSYEGYILTIMAMITIAIFIAIIGLREESEKSTILILGIIGLIIIIIIAIVEIYRAYKWRNK